MVAAISGIVGVAALGLNYTVHEHKVLYTVGVYLTGMAIGITLVETFT